MRKIAKVLSVMLCVCLAACTFAGCGGNKPDEVEKSVVGEWISTQGNSSVTLTFHDDLTLTNSSGGSMTYKHDGDGTDAVIGHYEVIKGSEGESCKWALPDNNKDAMYSFPNGVLNTSKPIMTRIKSA